MIEVKSFNKQYFLTFLSSKIHFIKMRMKYFFVENNINQSSISIYLFYLVTNLIYNYILHTAHN